LIEAQATALLPERNRALGRCAGTLAYRQERLAGEASPITLAMLQVAVGTFLEHLGARDDQLTPDHRAIAKATGQQLYHDLLHATDGAASRELISDVAAFGSIAEDLGVYHPKAPHSFAALARRAKKKDAQK
jgi:hypothetical protein